MSTKYKYGENGSYFDPETKRTYYKDPQYQKAYDDEWNRLEKLYKMKQEEQRRIERENFQKVLAQADALTKSMQALGYRVPLPWEQKNRFDGTKNSEIERSAPDKDSNSKWVDLKPGENNGYVTVDESGQYRPVSNWHDFSTKFMSVAHTNIANDLDTAIGGFLKDISNIYSNNSDDLLHHPINYFSNIGNDVESLYDEVAKLYESWGILSDDYNPNNPSTVKSLHDAFLPGLWGGTLQSTYVIPDDEIREKAILDAGYIKGKKGDYGPFAKEVLRTYRRSNSGNFGRWIETKLGAYRDPVTGKKLNGEDIPAEMKKVIEAVPVYQTAPDAINQEIIDRLIELCNYNPAYNLCVTDKDLVHAGATSGKLFVDPVTMRVYAKKWDLNDYGGGSGGKWDQQNKYNRRAGTGSSNFLSDWLDIVGHPAVVTTGYQKVQDLAELQNTDHPQGYPLIYLTAPNSTKGPILGKINSDGTYSNELPELIVYSSRSPYGNHWNYNDDDDD